MIDTHIHLSHEQYKEDIDAVIQSAKDNGVEKVVLIGCDKKSIPEAIELQKKDAEFFDLALGWHPVDVSDFSNEEFDNLKYQLENNKTVVALGEIGLDYHWYPEEEKLQKEVFEKQIKLAQKLDLPIIIHARDSYDDCYEILKKYSPVNGVIHSFAADAQMAEKFVDLGLQIGISGPITFKNGHNQKEVAKAIDLKNILLETDGPYLTPAPYRGKRNRPEYVDFVAAEIAFQKQTTKEEVIMQTTENAKKLFRRKNV